jgi:hypothetical protein
MDDINDFTEKRLSDVKSQQIPQQPGMPPPDPLFIKAFEGARKTNIKMLEIDMTEVRLLKKYVGGALCGFHAGIRSDPDGYMHPQGFPVLQSDRARAVARNAAAAPKI